MTPTTIRDPSETGLAFQPVNDLHRSMAIYGATGFREKTWIGSKGRDIENPIETAMGRKVHTIFRDSRPMIEIRESEVAKPCPKIL